jgi:signal peptidase I
MHTPPTPTRPNTPRRHHGGVRYIGELLVGVVLVCITMHTFFLAGLIVPVTVSGGSMAETILGPRREVVCPHCGIKFACGHERMPASGRAICLNCGFRDVDLNAGFDWPGKHALIDRASLAFRAPRRWEVLVFRCPEQADTYCIKRVVALPGEEIQIRAGDVYVNGKIARKNLAECREVAQLVHDAEFVPSGEESQSITPGWNVADANSNWSTQAHGSKSILAHTNKPLNPSETPPAKPSYDWLSFHALRNRPLTDDDSYNQSESRRLNQISDVMLSCELRCIGPGEVVIRSEIDGDRFEVRINPGQRLAVLSRNGEEVTRGELVPAAFTQPTSLELIRFDRQILLAIGGSLVLQQEFELLPDTSEQTEAESNETSRPWAIGTTALHIEVGHLRLLRDIYYTVPTTSQNSWGVRHPVTLADDEFFVLGDNSPISADSRILDKPGVERKSLIGRLLTTW